MRAKIGFRWVPLAVVVAFALASGMLAYSDDGDDDDQLVVDVRNDGATLDRALSDFNDPPAGAFFVQGDIFTPGGEDAGEAPIGVFRCWGWTIDADDGGGNIVSQEYHLFGLGRIELQGLETPAGLTRAVVGGTEAFKGVDGEAANTPFVFGGGFIRFTTTFDLDDD